jgi:hypothetical protein
MPHSVVHQFVSSKPDGADTSLVRPSNWNAGHVITIDLADNANLSNTLANSKLTNSSITLGSTSISLGATVGIINDLTIQTPSINGVVSTTGLTLPAFTLGGSLSGNLTLSTSGAAINLGSATDASTPAQTITILNSGRSAPSNANTTANGDKFVLWNDANRKLALGVDTTELFIQATGSGNSVKFYTGTSTSPVLALTIADNQLVTATNVNVTGTTTLNTSLNGLAKLTAGVVSAASSGVDYQPGTAGLATGIIKNTTGTGAFSIAVAGDFPILNQNTTGSAASCTGNSATATTASNVSIAEDSTTNSNMYPVWVAGAAGSQATKTTSSKLSFNPSTGRLTITEIAAGRLFVTGTTKTPGSFDVGVISPTSTNRLNYDGYFYANKFYGDGSALTGISGGGGGGSIGLSNDPPLIEGVAASGTAEMAARADHVHPAYGALASDDLPLAPGAASAGVSATVSRSDHVHPAGSGGATLSAVAGGTTYYPGMSATSSGAWADARVATTDLYYTSGDQTLYATNVNTASDARLKENVITINGAIDTINKLRGVSFNWKLTGKKSYGVIAQEIEKILPDVVNTVDDRKSVNYGSIIGILIEAVKELSAKVDALEAK